MARYVVSACLAGFRSRYDGTDKLVQRVRELVVKGEAVPFCPEQAGGLPTPRDPAEIIDGDGCDVLRGYGTTHNGAHVATEDGVDVTEQFVRGAEEMLKLASAVGATKAILKSGSPSCGAGAIYDGTFSGNITGGDGVTAALLKEHGIEVATEREFEDD